MSIQPLPENSPAAHFELKTAGESVVLRGWVNRRRDLGGLIFIDLRDRYGLTQIVFNPEIAPEAHAVASDVRNEFVLEATGVVRERPDGTKNPRLKTGDIEIEVHYLKVLNTALNPPFYINEDSDVDESLRLKYRYLDLRRERMQRNVLLRHQIVKYIRDFLDESRFRRSRNATCSFVAPLKAPATSSSRRADFRESSTRYRSRRSSSSSS